jgi:hypothetical protein
MVGYNPRMHVPAKVEYAIQAAAELAAAWSKPSKSPTPNRSRPSTCRTS